MGHTVATLRAPVYRRQNVGALRQDWPGIPLPDSKELLLVSAALGREMAALLDTEADVGAVREPPLQKIAVPTRLDGKPLDEAKDLTVTAGWGHAGKGGVTMPGKGRLIERDYTDEERAAFVGPSGARPAGELRSPLLGDPTCDVYDAGVHRQFLDSGGHFVGCDPLCISDEETAQGNRRRSPLRLYQYSFLRRTMYVVL